jgi:hypothetical protein
MAPVASQLQALPSYFVRRRATGRNFAALRKAHGKTFMAVNKLLRRP